MNIRLADTVNSKGSILIMVLIFFAVIALITNVVLSSGILQLKMVNNLQSSLKTSAIVQSKIQQLEQIIENNYLTMPPKGVEFIQFVPDTLHFNESAGVKFYRTMVEISQSDGSYRKRSSTIAVRGTIDKHKHGPFPPWFEQWQEQLSEDWAVQNPTTATLANNKWGVVVWSHSSKKMKNRLTIFDFNTGNMIKEFSIPVQGQTHDFVGMTLVDPKQSNVASLVYVALNSGHIYKFDLQAPDPVRWQIIYSLMGRPFFDNNNPVLAPIMVGRHPQGLGRILYLLESHGGKRVIKALWDDDNKLHSHFTIDNTLFMGPPLLRQSRLVVPDLGGVLIYDAFTGKLLGENSYHSFKSIHKDLAKPAAIASIVILDKKPREKKPTVQVFWPHGMGETTVMIDYEGLGRRTWH